jgi:hypothetical protein
MEVLNRILLYLSLLGFIAGLLLANVHMVVYSVCILLLFIPEYQYSKFKVIRSGGKLFLCRLSLYKDDGSSFKFHLILNDDGDEPHSHPWDFTSIILFGGYYEENVKYGFLDLNVKLYHQKHKIRLRRLFGFKVPTLTMGWYSEKKELCSLCKDLGYCRTTGKPI